MYTQERRSIQQVYIGIQGLFALVVALLNETIGFLGNVLIEEVGIVGDDSFEPIIEHDGSGMEIPAIAEPFGGPDSTDDMGMPVLAGIAIDDHWVGAHKGT
jgi:hypothetical protein